MSEPSGNKICRAQRQVAPAARRRRGVFRRDLARRFPASTMEEWRSAEGNRFHDRPGERQNHRPDRNCGNGAPVFRDRRRFARRRRCLPSIRRSASRIGRRTAAAEKTATSPVKPTKLVALRKASAGKENPCRGDAAVAPDRERRAGRRRPDNGRERGAAGSEFVGQDSTREGSRQNWLRSDKRRGTARHRSPARCRASSAPIIFED